MSLSCKQVVWVVMPALPDTSQRASAQSACVGAGAAGVWWNLSDNNADDGLSGVIKMLDFCDVAWNFDCLQFRNGFVN
ncbi:hypothetical protein E2542_SST02403 [Spatholobus suberectus]|nr:hypothetical protein E2542_SST02403 [Spatholobus suberectus]